MAPALPVGAIGQEAAACAVLGAVLGGVRAFFPAKGRAAFLPDVLFVGALLLGLQSYAASLSVGGVLRWYQLTAAVLAAAGTETVLRVPLRLAWAVLCLPVRWVRNRAAPVLAARKARKKCAKERRNAKRTAKNPKKNLPNQRRVLYNSNVSK